MLHPQFAGVTAIAANTSIAGSGIIA